MKDVRPRAEEEPDGPGAPGQALALGILGVHWAINYLVPAMMYGPGALLGFLPVFGLVAPFLWRAPRRLRTIAFWFCIFEIGVSGVLWFGSFVQFMNPIGLHFRLLGISIFTMRGMGEQFLFFAARAAIFAVAAALIRTMPKLPATADEPVK